MGRTTNCNVDGQTQETEPAIPCRDYVAADGTMLNEYFGDTEDEHVEPDDPVEHGSAEDLLSLRQGESVAVGDPPPTGADEPDEEEEDLEFQSAGEFEEGSAEFLLANGGNAAQTSGFTRQNFEEEKKRFFCFYFPGFFWLLEQCSFRLWNLDSK